MNSSSAALVRAVRGPLVLIAIGMLFAIDHFGTIGFEQTWPVLIILIGLLKLLERMVGGSGSAPPQPVQPQAGPWQGGQHQ